jgi:hypothetical protein
VRPHPNGPRNSANWGQTTPIIHTFKYASSGQQHHHTPESRSARPVPQGPNPPIAAAQTERRVIQESQNSEQSISTQKTNDQYTRSTRRPHERHLVSYCDLDQNEPTGDHIELGTVTKTKRNDTTERTEENTQGNHEEKLEPNKNIQPAFLA